LDVVVAALVSARTPVFRLARLLPIFGARRAHQVGPADVRAYVAKRLEEGASNGTINRELAALRRAYTLGVDGQMIQRAPKIKALDENNARAGFFEREQLEALRRHLREPLRPVVPRSVAMKMVGHKTEAVYRRYAIVSESDLHDAARKLAALPTGTFTGALAAVVE